MKNPVKHFHLMILFIFSCETQITSDTSEIASMSVVSIIIWLGGSLETLPMIKAM